ncbi:MAG: bifunctional 5,10-methylenetetrahydrofolate dehydrogenase/5,10-methenyltetrahydrofolate cyclohydrolase [Bacteroidales bacterium]|jgi:methylenetetrahydrofolate dehydrogenase (NADP+)/methenyltetrahydrofolate cyclohydrolase|nr:bifunctional 5,10-methylenetetrahydrofolate dehydrogenase/5,10-methenyltetrahydrofolate cyclohydrolase [Bacteroidales bacterium]
MTLIDGKQIAEKIKIELTQKVQQISSLPHLAAIIAGNAPASETYIAAKEHACNAVGIKSSIIRLSESTTENELLYRVAQLNDDDSITGFIVQLPLPEHINSDKVLLSIAPSKDVDGFHPENLGKMLTEQDCFLPATPFGIVQLLEHYNIKTESKDCVIIGRSNIVGSPLSILLSRKKYNCTVTLCHSKTKNLAEKCRNADILIAAIGKPHFVTADMVKDGATVIDVGIHRIGGKITGDVDFENVAPKCSYITPVPGGVGVMTVVSLLQNVITAALKK